MNRFLLALALAVGLVTHGVATAQQPPTALPGPAYRINPGDEIEVFVWGDERLQRSVRVLPDGTFAFPLVGQVVAHGQLPADIERIITAALRPQYRGWWAGSPRARVGAPRARWSRAPRAEPVE